jgi:hypothetical protein
MGARAVVGAIIMPAGKYYVGDPCYAVPNDRWMEWLEAADYENERRFLLADLDGYDCLGIGTAHGDGCYEGDDGNEYGVDAGLIGVVHEEVGKKGSTLYACQLVEFPEDFTCTYEEDEGTIVLGHIRIKTDPPLWECEC